MRTAQRKAESQMKSALNKAEAEANRKLRQWESDSNRKLKAATRPSVTYTATERRLLIPVGQQALAQADQFPEKKDVFLCHAWDDRLSTAKELADCLEEFGVSVWFSEKNVSFGSLLVREIDRGLKASRIGVVLVTPNMLKSLSNQGIADKELSALLATDRVIPVAHGTTFEALREESPLLASRSGLSTSDSSIREVAAKIANSICPTE
jgi:hypothetical protein